MALFIEEKLSCHGCNTKNKPKAAIRIAKYCPRCRRLLRNNAAKITTQNGMVQLRIATFFALLLTNAYCARLTILQVCNRAMAKVYLNGVGRISRPRNKRTMNKTRAPKMQRKAVKLKAPM